MSPPNEQQHAKTFAIASKDSLKPGQMSCFDVNQQRIILARVENEYFAFDEMCSHEEAELWRGALRKDHIECPLHGSRFCLRTGEPMEEPATDPISTYPVIIKEETIYIELVE